MFALRCVLQCVAVCCSLLMRVAVCRSVLQCVPVCCSVSQCVAGVRTTGAHCTHMWEKGSERESGDERGK